MPRLLRYAITVSMISLILSLWLADGAARGQSSGTATDTSTPTATPVASPTVTSPPSIPSGQDLLTQSGTAVAAKNTFHETLRLNLAIPSLARVDERFQGDISLKPLLEHLVGTIRTTQLNTQPAKTTTQRAQIIVVKKKEGTKTGKKAWSCSAVDQTTQVASGLLGSAQIQSVDNLGAETVGAVPAWHVRAVVTVKVSGQTLPATADLYISQADLTLVRMIASASASISGVTVNEKVVQNFSKYGEKVKVTLPAACKGKTTSADAVVARLAPVFDNPAALAGRLGTATWAFTHQVHTGP
jgi:hypothetical protein